MLIADEAGDRHIKTVSHLLFEAFVANVPDIPMQFFKTQSLQRAGKPLFCRVTITETLKTAVYKPHPLTDNQMADSHLKRSMAGAAFLGNFNKLPKTHFRVVWEVTKTAPPSSMLKPIRPKIWSMGKINMKADFFYTIH